MNLDLSEKNTRLGSAGLTLQAGAGIVGIAGLCASERAGDETFTNISILQISSILWMVTMQPMLMLTHESAHAGGVGA